MLGAGAQSGAMSRRENGRAGGGGGGEGKVPGTEGIVKNFPSFCEDSLPP